MRLKKEIIERIDNVTKAKIAARIGYSGDAINKALKRNGNKDTNVLLTLPVLQVIAENLLGDSNNIFDLIEN